jgi:predicted hotdog family 3-hydroxylacyl-ACP dehydratase
MLETRERERIEMGFLASERKITLKVQSLKEKEREK